MVKPTPEVVFIGAGGTIASIGKDPFDVLDYGNNDKRFHAEEIIASLPPLSGLTRVTPVRFPNIENTAVIAEEGSFLGASRRMGIHMTLTGRSSGMAESLSLVMTDPSACHTARAQGRG
ncbi:hypothetical protein [Mesorhizobium shangrilense]|uniref:Asparaginase n=1 Tax=Mesorhizobium shangrilense TaxID=460060 RepID=A0ABV2DMP5_9HYPH